MIRIAIDIGGTFTDGIALDPASGAIWAAKALTTPADPGIAAQEVIAALLAQGGGSAAWAGVDEVVHATTLVTNALIERRGARVALLLTRGTRDVLDIRRELRYDLYDLDIRLPPALVPREARIEVAERMDADGAALMPLAPSAVAATVAALRDLTEPPEAIAICFLHGFREPVHERAMAQAVAAAMPGLPVSLASAVARESGEYERMSTTVANAYVQPLVRDYLRGFERRVASLGLAAPVRIMVSGGGFTTPDAAAATPVHLLESGPAGGVLSAMNTAQAHGLNDILAFDMGGTTAKACLVTDGSPSVARSFEAARVHRFKRGSGLPILGTSVDLIEIGAGGGSLARPSPLGLLAVGPESAGAVPGPACYGRGGTEPTVTDADLALGYLDPARFLGGEMPLSPAAAEAALADLGARLGLDAQAVARGIYDLVNENMAAAARVHVAEKGQDPRRFTLVATGGAGPVHAVEVARRLGLSRVLVPIGVGVGSCLGLLSAPPRADRAWSDPADLNAIAWPRVAAELAALRAEAEAELSAAGVASCDLDMRLTADMRYAGQAHDVSVDLPWPEQFGSQLANSLSENFLRRYRELYGRVIEGGLLRVIAWRVSAHGAHRTLRFQWGRQPGTSAAVRSRAIYLPAERRLAHVPVRDRYSLAPGTLLYGPLVLEERESTLVVPVAAEVRVLDDLSVSVVLPCADASMLSASQVPRAH